MANIGVSIDEVWQQGSLLPQQQASSAPRKSSKYTVPVEEMYVHSQHSQPPNYRQQQQAPQQQQYMQQMGGYEEANPNQIEYFGNQYLYNNQVPQQMPPQQQQQMMAPQQQMPPQQQQQKGVAAQGPPQPQDQNAELQEMMAKQIMNFSNCQKDIQYLKTIIQHMKREVTESRQQSESKEDKRIKWGVVFWLFLLTMLVVIILILVIGMSHKVNMLVNSNLSAPTLME